MSRSLIIAGMHRSGTSALAGALNALGVDFGPQTMPSSEANPKGYFEHVGIYRAHELLLAKLSRSWSDLRPFPENWLHNPLVNEFRQTLKELIQQDFGSSSLWGVKDPRMCRLLPVWFYLFDELEITPSVLIPIRHPTEVSESLWRRDGLDREQGGLLWMLHLMETEQATRGRPRMFLRFSDLLADPNKIISQVADAFQLDWPNREQATILNEFIEPALHHNQATEKFDHFGRGSQLIRQGWQVASQETGAPQDQSLLWDELRSTYCNVLKKFDQNYLDEIGNLKARLSYLELTLQDHNQLLEKLVLSNRNSWYQKLRWGRKKLS